MASGASPKPIYEMVSHIIDINKEPPEDLNTSTCNIYRVPRSLWNLNKEAYTPQLVSIGPLHFDLKNQNPMQHQKLRYFGYFWVRINNNEEAMKGYKQYLEDEEAAIRHCYAELPTITKQQLVEMMLLDSVFIMELFLRIQEKKPQEHYKDDIILKQTWLSKSVCRDLLLLENQILLFILNRLYVTVVPDSDKKHEKFIELAYEYFKCIHPYKKSESYYDEVEMSSSGDHHKLSKSRHCSQYSVQSQKDCSHRSALSVKNWKNEPLHFTDMIRYFYLYKDLTLREKGSSCNALRTATKLREAGVSFEKVFDKNLLDIKFVTDPFLSWFLCLGCISKFKCFKARLQIPQLKIEDITECVLRNLIAFEQCHYSGEPYICNYVSFIDSLIHTKEDVELLVEKEVIVHELGSDKEVATLVNNLCKHLVTDKTCYKSTIDHLNEHYQNVWNHTMASLMLVYFRDTWRASSTVVGIAILIFAVFNFYRLYLHHTSPHWF
ncbi:hypothetical protein QN277_023578 [Acacia crassicarpa]|uniref:Uncharacterized protein n=1 Tax=Acacia crassicarpa TaxID=499986 RepID=A0AAE1JHG5_9FABA|nr:hypothetical protein QN277_023578 [Acacia crassicarpa]